MDDVMQSVIRFSCLKVKAIGKDTEIIKFK